MLIDEIRRLVDNSCSNDDKALILLLEKEKVWESRSGSRKVDGLLVCLDRGIDMVVGRIWRSSFINTLIISLLVNKVGWGFVYKENARCETGVFDFVSVCV